MSTLVYPSQVIVIASHARAEVLDAAKAALISLDRLHLIPARPPCLVRMRGRRGEEGRYDSNPPHVDLHPKADHPGFTFVHEVGHFLDNRCLHVIYKGWASEIDPDFETIIKCWLNSRHVKRLTHLQNKYRLRAITGYERKYLESLTMRRELWACTYAQWVATKTDNPQLKTELNRLIPPTGHIAGEPYSIQWEENDFKDIMCAVDDLFKKRNWL